MDADMKTLLEKQGEALDALKVNADEQGKAFEDYKAANDERLAEIAKTGSADPITEEKVQRISDELDKFEDLNGRVIGAQKAVDAALEAQKELAESNEKRDGQLDRIEVMLKRPNTDGGGEAEQSAEAKGFWAYMRKDVQLLEPDEKKVLTVGDDTAAGYLAPIEYVREIIKAQTVISPLRSIARVRQTSQRGINIPKRTGQFAAVWTAETGTRSETTGLTYGMEEIPTHEQSALVDLSNQIIEDAVFNLEAELQMEFSERFALAEGTAFVSGNAVSKPEGFMTNGDVGEDTSGSASTIADTDGEINGLITLQHNIKEFYTANANWVLNRKTIGAIRKLKDANESYIWQTGFSAGVPNSILGDPYVEMTDMPDEGSNTYPIAYGDFRRAYTILDRISLSVLRDPFTQAAAGNIRFVARRRVGGQVVLAEAIRKLKCST